MSSIYFCIFCPQKFTSTEGKNELKEHLIESHLSEESNVYSIDEWLNSLINYESELNQSFNSTPYRLPEKSVNELLIGCKLCDIIIDCFKLKIETKNKMKNVCVCGEEENSSVVTICKECNHLFHYNCVESITYSDQNLSLFICINCKPKRFKILELKSKSNQLQKIHCFSHLYYEPFICRFNNCDDNQLECSKRFFHYLYFLSHLKTEHKVNTEKLSQNELKSLYKCEQISKVNDLIENSLEKSVTKIIGFSSIAIETKIESPLVQNEKNSTLDNSSKRKSKSCDNSLKQFIETSLNETQKCIQKRPVGRPRKSSLNRSQVSTQSKSSNSSLRSSKSSRRVSIINYKEDKSDESSEWDSDVEKFEQHLKNNLRLVQHNLNKKRIEQKETQRLAKDDKKELNVDESRKEIEW